MSNPSYLFSLSTHSQTINVKSLDVTFFKPDIDFSKYDYLIITSKQTLQALKQYRSSEYLCKKAIIISTKTAQEFEDLGGEVLELGEGYGSNLGEKIRTYPKKTKWLYLRAKTVASNFVQESIDEGFSIDEFILYETQCSLDIQNIIVPQNATLIFTSPSSVECYLKNHQISEGNKVIVIGLTTANKLPKGIDYLVPSETTIQSCIDLLI